MTYRSFAKSRSAGRMSQTKSFSLYTITIKHWNPGRHNDFVRQFSEFLPNIVYSYLGTGANHTHAQDVGVVRQLFFITNEGDCMKKLLAILAATAFLGLVGCQPAEEEPVENAMEETEEAFDEAADATEEAVEETGDAMEEGWEETTDAVDDAVEMEDVNDEEMSDETPVE